MSRRFPKTPLNCEAGSPKTRCLGRPSRRRGILVSVTHVPDSPTHEEPFERALTRVSAGARWITLMGPVGVGKRRVAARLAERLGAHVRVLRTTLPTPETLDAARAHLDAAPTHVVISTSLVPFGVTGEAVIEVEPLAPAPALALFEQLRVAGSVRPIAPAPIAGPISTRERDRASALVATLDGLPLAIEVAAAAVPVLGFDFTLEELLALTEVAGSPNPLAALLEDALSASVPDVAAIERLALFQDTFGLDDARAMLGAEAPLAIYSYVRSGWLRMEDEGRVRFLQPVRAFLRRRLRTRPDELEAARESYARWWFRRERAASADDLLCATSWWLDQRRPEEAISLVLRAEEALRGRTHVEFPAMLDAALSLAEAASLRSVEVACALRARGRLARTLGHHDEARDALRAAAAMANELQAGGVVRARCAIELAEVAAARGDRDLADRSVRDALEAARDVDASVASEVLRRAASLRRVWSGGEDALELHAESVALARRAGDRRALATALGSFVVALLERRELESFHRLWPEARTELAAQDDAVGLAIVDSAVAIASAIEGDLDEARTRLTRSREAFRRFEQPQNEAIVLLDLGWLALEAEDPVATRHFEEALALGRGTGVAWIETKATAGLAIALLVAGRLLESAAERRRAKSLADASDVDLGLALALVDVLHVTSGLDEADAATVSERLEAARERLRAYDERSITDLAIRRLLERWLRRAERIDLRPTLLVDDEGWFRTPGEPWVDLRRRPTLRRVLSCLARASHEGRDGVSTSELFEEGWPGERVLTAAAAARVHVAINTLRKLGLRDLLERGETGYHLSEELRVLVGSYDPAQRPASVDVANRADGPSKRPRERR
ncbi:MAG: hypothetical protein R3B99_18080 [Polyangiales bacterium]